MITPVKFELAKLIKDKGFVNVCEKVYRSDGLLYTPHTSGSNLKHSNILEDESYSAPTISEVVMWLYEKHGIWISVDIDDIKEFYSNVNGFETCFGKINPTEAYEATIHYCLTNLI